MYVEPAQAAPGVGNAQRLQLQLAASALALLCVVAGFGSFLLVPCLLIAVSRRSWVLRWDHSTSLANNRVMETDVWQAWKALMWRCMHAAEKLWPSGVHAGRDWPCVCRWQ